MRLELFLSYPSGPQCRHSSARLPYGTASNSTERCHGTGGGDHCRLIVATFLDDSRITTVEMEIQKASPS